jgi:hypothetical protein
LFYFGSFAQGLVGRIGSLKLASLLHSDCPNERWAPGKL